MTTLGVFEWVNFLDLAPELAASLNDEAAVRTAIGRACYARFHKGRDDLRHAGISLVRSYDAHGRFKTHFGRSAQRLDRIQNSLMFGRSGDYDDLPVADIGEQVHSGVNLTGQTIDATKALS